MSLGAHKQSDLVVSSLAKIPCSVYLGLQCQWIDKTAILRGINDMYMEEANMIRAMLGNHGIFLRAKTDARCCPEQNIRSGVRVFPGGVTLADISDTENKGP